VTAGLGVPDFVTGAIVEGGEVIPELGVRVVEAVGDNVDGDLVGAGVGKLVGDTVKGAFVGSGVAERTGEDVGVDV
jgi:hypothetical protein